MFNKLLTNFRQDIATICEPTDCSTYDDLSLLETIIILLEDRRFFQHRGVDWKSWAREFWRMITFQNFGGASTIDMQFVRTKTGYRSRTIQRKIYEMILARAIQKRLDKITILRSYLKIVYLGSGINGVEAAARIVFGKAVFELDKRQAATVAAMMVYPRPLAPSPSWHMRIFRRAEYGLHLYEVHASQYRRHIED